LINEEYAVRDNKAMLAVYDGLPHATFCCRCYQWHQLWMTWSHSSAGMYNNTSLFIDLSQEELEKFDQVLMQ